jgi:RNA polymerase sigma-70 factor, ECF subfamily
VRIFGASAGDRDDLVQEVFLVAHRRLSDFDGRNALGWLHLITRRKMRDYHRLAWVQHFRRCKDVYLMDDAPSTNQGPLEELETKRQRLAFARMVSALEIGQRAAFELFEVEGRSGAEIAALLGAPVNTVWQWLYQARKELYTRSLRTTDLSPLARKAASRYVQL